MSIDLLKAAEDDLERIEIREKQLRAELEHLQDERLQVVAFRERLKIYLYKTPDTEKTAEVPGRQTNGASEKRIPREGSKSALLAATCLESMQATGEPYLINELLKVVHAAGIEINSEKPSAYLAGVLSRDPRFTFTLGIGWTIVDQAKNIGGSVSPSHVNAEHPDSLSTSAAVKPAGGGGT